MFRVQSYKKKLKERKFDKKNVACVIFMSIPEGCQGQRTI